MRLTVKVKPNANKNEIKRWFDDKTCKISVTAPPQDGKANKELLGFLAKLLDIPKSSITIIHGANSKTKLIEIPDAAKLKIKDMQNQLGE